MTVTTSKGKTFTVDWMWGPIGQGRELRLRLRDDRPLSEIAVEFEGCDHFHRESAEEGNMDFDGYTVLRSIFRPTPDYGDDAAAVQIILTRPV